MKRMLVNVAWCGLVIAGFPGGILSAEAQEASAPVRESSSASNARLVARTEQPIALSELPDSPGTSKLMETLQQQSGSTPSTNQSQDSNRPQDPSNQAPSNQSQAQSPGQKPVGTAAAEAPDASGIAASQPAGIAMAPAKQRRTRTLVLKMGAIIGAGVAVGSVVALTAATPSKPPGAH